MSPKPRVAQVITRMIVGGAQETVLLAAALAQDVESIVVTGPQTGPEGSLLDACRDRGVQVVLVHELVRQVNPWRDLMAVSAVRRALRGVDLVHTHSSKAGVIGRLAARSAGLPAVHTVHGWPFHDEQPAVVRHTWQGVERLLAPLAQRLLVVADADRAKGLRAGVGEPDQYRTVRSGLELELYGADPAVRQTVREELGIPAGAFVVGAVNRLSPQKDPITLLRALLPVLRQRAHARLLVVGDGPLRADIERMAAETPGQIVLTGLRTDVPRLLRAVDLFVSASRWEGLPRTVLQAMATGVPVVATAVDGIVDVIEHERTGLLVSPGDPGALTVAVVRLMDAPSQRADMAQAAADRVPDFDARRMVSQLETLYAELLAAK